MFLAKIPDQLQSSTCLYNEKEGSSSNGRTPFVSLALPANQKHKKFCGTDNNKKTISNHAY
jgi:hypothetical protein